MSDCWVVGFGFVDLFVLVLVVEDEGNDGLRMLLRLEVVEGVKGIEGGWMVMLFIFSGWVWLKVLVLKKEWMIMVFDRMFVGYLVLNVLSRDEIRNYLKSKKDEIYGDFLGVFIKINVFENDLYVFEGNFLNCFWIIKYNFICFFLLFSI